MNRYTNRERAAVKSVVVDLNAQYIKFIKALFPNTLDLIVKNRGFARNQRMEHRLRQRCICQKSHS